MRILSVWKNEIRRLEDPPKNKTDIHCTLFRSILQIGNYSIPYLLHISFGFQCPSQRYTINPAADLEVNKNVLSISHLHDPSDDEFRHAA